MEETVRPPQIKPKHLARLSVVYARQSTEHQVEQNVGSTEAQLAQAVYARKWGWPDERIKVVSCDLGLTGSASRHRSGYVELCKEIDADRVGLVLVSDLSRLGRETVELLTFLDRCAKHGTLIATDGQIHDTSNSTDRFTQTILSTVVSFENDRRKEILRRGALAKIDMGMAITKPPAGFVKIDQGKWGLDPDPEVQGAIRTAFHEYLKRRSLLSTLRTLIDQGVNLPRRGRGVPGKLRWARPNTTELARMFANPAYAGHYQYGRLRVDKTRERSHRGLLRMRRGNVRDIVIIRDHHDAYITQEEWAEIRAIAERHARTKDRSNLGPGPALLQGLVRCEIHGSRMSPNYQRKYGPTPLYGYGCSGAYEAGGQSCGRVHGPSVDQAVEDAIIDRIQPVKIDELREAWSASRRDQEAGLLQQRTRLSRARRQVAEAEERVQAIDPRFARVHMQLIKDWEEKLAELHALESEAQRPGQSEYHFGEHDWDELQSLAENIATILHAETTTIGDRKELARIMVRRVAVHGRSKGRVNVEIIWADGVESTHVEVRTPYYCGTVIQARMAAGMSPEQILSEMTSEGLRTPAGHAWTLRGIKQTMSRIRRGRRT